MASHRLVQSSMSRRTFLRAAGTVVALPLLASLEPRSARAAASAYPQRLVTFFLSHGLYVPNFTPTTTGADFAMTPILQPLTALRNYVTVATGLSATEGKRQDPLPGGDHAHGTGAFGSGSRVVPTDGGTFAGGGMTYDQVVAQAIGTQTRFPSLHLLARTGGGGDALAGDYTTTLSWKDSKTPVKCIDQAATAFSQLFGNGDLGQTATAAAQRAAARKSVLDGVMGQTTTLMQRLSQADQSKLDQYLTSLREVEREVTLTLPPQCTSIAAPAPTSTFEANVKAYINVMKLAVQCDATRVLSLMLGPGGADWDCSFLSYNGRPINSSFHTVAHYGFNQSQADSNGALTVIQTWAVNLIAGFAQALHDTPEGAGNMLDNTIIYLGSEIDHSNNHTHVSMPVLLVGKGGGAYAGNRHLVYSNNETVADLYMYMMQQFGVTMTSFGESGKQILQGLG